jgi:exosome complex RNA-binding protein Rrp4
MYTVEFDFDSSTITSMDETAEHEDVEVILGDNGDVFIRQFDEDLQKYEMVIMSYQQFLDINAALNSTEGMYRLKFLRGDKR